MRDLRSDTVASTRAVLVLGCLAGLTTYLLTPLTQPEQVMLASDVYRHAAGSLLAGEGIYGINPPDRSGYTFLYPPIVVLVFIPHALLGSSIAAFALQTVLNLLAALATAWIIYRTLLRRGRPVSRLDLGLLGLVMVVSSYSAIQFLNGQITLWLALALAIGFEAFELGKARLAGGAFALAALLKVFPAVLGLWLIRQRAWRAVAAAVATGLGGLILGVLILGPDLTLAYLTDVLLGRFDASTYSGLPNPGDNVDGIHRQLAVLWPGGTTFHTPIGLVVVGGLVLAAYRRVDTRLRRDVAALATTTGILLFLPLQPLYFPLITFPLFMLLYTEAAVLPRRLLLAGTLLTFVHLDQEGVELVLLVLPIPALVAEPIRALTGAAFTFVLPPTLGLWVLLLTCVLVQLPAPESRPRRSTTTPADD